MKKLLLLFVFILIFSQLTSAQIYKGFGLKTGTTIATQESNGYFGNSLFKIGFMGGLFKETAIFEKLNFIVGINYTQKGFRIELQSMDEFGHYLGIVYGHQNINFISTELNLKYDGNKEKISPYIFAGLRMDIMLSHNYTTKGKEEPFELLTFSGNKTFGGNFGAGLSYKPSNLYTLFIEGTYNPDFTNLIERNDVYISEYLRWYKGNSFDIRTGIKF